MGEAMGGHQLQAVRVPVAPDKRGKFLLDIAVTLATYSSAITRCCTEPQVKIGLRNGE